MSKKGRFELNRSGVRELFQCAEMQTVIGEYCQRVSNNAGSGFTYNVQTANRAVGRVFADTKEAEKSNSENNVLLKALR